tara:strand:+ start:1931 stop:2233 length:303 start_codon:yes stop_codon:yes gene_type:complete
LIAVRELLHRLQPDLPVAGLNQLRPLGLVKGFNVQFGAGQFRLGYVKPAGYPGQAQRPTVGLAELAADQGFELQRRRLAGFTPWRLKAGHAQEQQAGAQR